MFSGMFTAMSFSGINKKFPGDNHKGLCSIIPGRVSRKSQIRFQVCLLPVFRIAADFRILAASDLWDEDWVLGGGSRISEEFQH